MFYQVFRSTVFSLALILFCSHLGIAQSTSGSSAGFSRQITGIVRYGDSKLPAENVLVRLESFGGGLVAQVMTDKTGKFAFYGLRGETFVVTIHAPGYLEMRQQIELMTQFTDYINAVLVRDRETGIASTPSSPGPSVINAGVPADAQTEYSAAKAILDSGKKEKIPEAVQHLKKAVAAYPSYLEAQLLLGFAYMDLHDWNNAETALRTAVEINHEASTAYIALGEVYRRQKKFTDAENVIQQGLKLNDQSAEGHYTLANVFYEIAPSAGDEAKFKLYLESAWREVKRSIELNPKLAGAHLLAGDLLLRARHAKEALAHFEEYLKLEPNGEYADQTKTMVEKIKKALSESKSS